MRLPAELRATLQVSAIRDQNDSYAEISRTAPGGFGGIFVDDNSHWVLLFVDPAAANNARDQVKEAFETLAFGGGPPVDWVRAEFRGARWSFAELDEWFRYIVPKIGQTGSGVSLMDIDEKANTINIGVIDETARRQLESQLASLNVSCNLVTTVIRGYATIET